MPAEQAVTGKAALPGHELTITPTTSLAGAPRWYYRCQCGARGNPRAISDTAWIDGRAHLSLVGVLNEQEGPDGATLAV